MSYKVDLSEYFKKQSKTFQGQGSNLKRRKKYELDLNAK